MPKVIIEHSCSLSPQDAFQKVKTVLEDAQDLKKLDPGYACRFDDANMTGEAAGKMFKAALAVKGAGASTKVQITVDLPLALALAKGVVEKTLRRKLEVSLA